MLQTLAIAHYRSLHGLVLPLQPLNVITGDNGSGKSNLYRALRLLAETAQGGVAASLAREGGLGSALWAGPEALDRRVADGRIPLQGGPRQAPVGLKLGFATAEFGYAVDLGYPPPMRSAFALDPQIKAEAIWAGPFLRSANALVERHGARVRRRSGNRWEGMEEGLSLFESLFTQVADPQRMPETLLLRDYIRRWRFYDHFRSDADAPARQPAMATRTPVLHHDGRDLAAAWVTILEIGDPQALAHSVEDAFPGAAVGYEEHDGRLVLRFHQPGLLRPLSMAEVSDGTLRFLLLAAALHTPRPPPLLVLNEPETSLHPDLLPALARLIVAASARSQVWVVSHASRLIAALEQAPGCQRLHLHKEQGRTLLAGQGLLDAPAWHWPAR
ncbi:AAA family ATPase [Stenotrophomonas sp. 24(2023)]|uniref:AAA family ATPase n=1 Tax=Stenotrophomonas sp. 24(2023) TaxID=3068324 RepID=UPI0027E1A96F|nr:AAA family ATPase [Stenotrophomonas sp. 24(2023)]WMJ68465.1 AAA family ATPase [Stenotrophomonas sp. 24(2023)]